MTEKMSKPHIILGPTGTWIVENPYYVFVKHGRKIPSKDIVLNVGESWIPTFDRAVAFALRLNDARVHA